MHFRKLIASTLLFLGTSAEINKNDALRTTDSAVHLSHHTFESTVMANPDMPFLIFVYADWCGHCTNFKPTF